MCFDTSPILANNANLFKVKILILNLIFSGDGGSHVGSSSGDGELKVI